ncbi:hypothetical protein DE146DRAFT_631613 [Phaeosphaeria sp. MPI-PUGE-AT-0046c]|nr:hypothetical protein DE146DRAFT_631613 [Phaeosphaeria sp. MPI-PUGE-AT-0046c]
MPWLSSSRPLATVWFRALGLDFGWSQNMTLSTTGTTVWLFDDIPLSISDPTLAKCMMVGECGWDDNPTSTRYHDRDGAKRIRWIQYGSVAATSRLVDLEAV